MFGIGMLLKSSSLHRQVQSVNERQLVSPRHSATSSGWSWESNDTNELNWNGESGRFKELKSR